MALIPAVSQYYEEHLALRNFVGCVVVALGLFLALLELKHSGEANDQRAEQNRLAGIANESRTEANRYREDANRLIGERNKLQQETHALQVEIHQLEKRLTKVRLYARVHASGPEVQLLISNLSEFDLWLNQVEAVVSDAGNGKAANHTFGGARRISRGHAEDGYDLYRALVSINGGRTDRINMKFHVKVVAVGVEDAPVTIKSPEYHLRLEQGKATELEVLKYEP
jgi:hypothetical protein